MGIKKNNNTHKKDMKAFACLAIASAVSAVQLQSQNPAASLQMAQVQGGDYWDSLTADTARLMKEKDAATGSLLKRVLTMTVLVRTICGRKSRAMECGTS